MYEILTVDTWLERQEAGRCIAQALRLLDARQPVLRELRTTSFGWTDRVHAGAEVYAVVFPPDEGPRGFELHVIRTHSRTSFAAPRDPDAIRLLNALGDELCYSHRVRQQRIETWPKQTPARKMITWLRGWWSALVRVLRSPPR